LYKTAVEAKKSKSNPTVCKMQIWDNVTGSV